MGSQLDSIDEAEAWDRLVLSMPHASPLQSWAWGEVKARHGWRIRRFLWSRDGKAAGVIGVLERRLPAGLALHYAPRGPLLQRPTPAALGELCHHLRPALGRRGVVLKVDPEWSVDEGASAAALEAAGLRRGLRDIQHRSTYLLDIAGTEAEVLARVKPVTRYNIRYAARHGVTVRSGTDAALFATFFELLQASAARTGFTIRPARYYGDVLQAFAARGQGRLFLAERAGEPLGAVFTVLYGTRLYYLFGGSNLHHKELKPNYLLHWEAIRYARDRGCTTYDLWGIPLDPKPDHPGYGYYVFKTKFNGQPQRFIGIWDFPLRPLLYQGFRLGERLRSGDQPEFV